MAKTTVAVRMYNVGFGDAFLVTVTRGRRRWRMLVDCGVHSHGRARPIREAVDAIVADLAAEANGDGPMLDVVVATHHHADHISGFALEAWEQVAVDEVWVPFVEDEDDADAQRLRQAHAFAAERLLGLIERRTFGVDPGAWPLSLVTARAFAVNSFGNAAATDRLLGRNGLGFATKPAIRYLPYLEAARNTIETTIPGVVARVLGPSRDPAHIKRMHPPASAGWLRLDGEDDGGDVDPDAPLFNDDYVLGAAEVPDHLRDAARSLRLDQVTNDEGVLSAASILERSVNNTSLFFVLDVMGTRLLFPGDAQQGAWDHVLDDEDSRALVKDVVFYKIAHHGSHNATPRRYVEEVLSGNAYAMLPWGLVKRWKEIPKAELLAALVERNHRIIRADAPEAEPGRVTVNGDIWSEVTFSVS